MRRGFAGLARLTPPPRLTRGHGGDEFHSIGARWAETFRLHADLIAGETVLDIGCGPGRMALALAPLLGESSRYEGFDVRAEDIAWCKKKIEPRWARSHFQSVGLRNEHYNPNGAAGAQDFHFPYADATFDFAFMTSVATHLLPAVLANYLREIARVLKPSGRCLVSFFLLNQPARDAIKSGKARMAFAHPVGTCWTEFPERPEHAIAYEDVDGRAAYLDAGLALVEPIRYGAWSTAFRHLAPRHSQDMILARRG